MYRAVFLDRDGTLNHDDGYTSRADELRLYDHAAAGLRLLARQGFLLIVTTNQSGIARGYFREREMRAFHHHLSAVLRVEGVVLDAIYHCPYHPTTSVGRYRRDSTLRKPRPRMLLRAARQHGIDLSRSYAVGDKKSDVLAGQAAGCRTVLVQTGDAGRSEPDLAARPDHVARDLHAAAEWIGADAAARVQVRPTLLTATS